MLVDLKSMESFELEFRLNGLCSVDRFLNLYVENGFVHMPDDRNSLIFAWDFPNGRLVSLNLEVSACKTVACLCKDHSNLNELDLGLVPWMSKDYSRVLIHRRQAGLFKLELYDNSGWRPGFALFKSNHVCFRYKRQKAARVLFVHAKGNHSRSWSRNN